jgi:ferrous iron transport protein B
VEQKKDSFLGKVGQAIAPVFAPLGFGNWEAASSLVTGVIAKEIVVGTMGQIYVQEPEEEPEGPQPSLSEELAGIGTSFAGAVADAFRNVFTTAGIATISAEEEEGQDSLKSSIARTFTPLSAYAFMAFVLLYMPCVIAAAAFRDEFGSWKWYGVAFAYQTVLAWTAALVIYQGGRLLGLGG